VGLGVEYRIEIDGNDVTSTWKAERRLLSIEVSDQEGETSDSCTLTLDDHAPHIAWPPEGARLRLWLGTSQADLVDMGSFTLDAPAASSPPDRLTVSGHAANFVTSGHGLPLQTQRSRTWSAISLGNMVDTIAQEHNLLPRVQSQLSGELVDPVEQLWESDLAFLKRIAKRYDARVRVKGATGHPGGALEVVGGGSQLPQVVLSRRDVEQWSAPLGARVKAGSVTAFWFKPKTGQSGSKTAGKGAPHLVSTEAFETPASALAHAKARLKDTERHSAQLSVTLTRLDTSIASGTPVALAGFRSEIDTVWNVVQVRHSADAHRARTSLVAEKAE
jgi:phage protein D